MLEGEKSPVRFAASDSIIFKANLCLPDFLTLCSQEVLKLNAVRQVFEKKCFLQLEVYRGSSRLTCNTFWITSFKLVLKELITHVTNESLRSRLAVEKLSQIWWAHFWSVHRNWMACWWKEDSPICGGDIHKVLHGCPRNLSFNSCVFINALTKKSNNHKIQTSQYKTSTQFNSNVATFLLVHGTGH